MERIVRNTVVYIYGGVLPRVISFFLLPIYTRYLSPYEYGIIGAMEVITFLLTIIFSLEINRSIYRCYFDYYTEREKKEFLGTIAISMLINSVVWILVIFSAKGVIQKIYKTIDFYPYYFLVIIATFFSIFWFIPKAYFQVTEQAGKFVIFSILIFLLETGFNVYFIIFRGMGAKGMFVGRVISQVLMLPICIYLIAKIANFKFNFDKFKNAINFSLPMVPILLSSWVLNLVDRVFIERYFDLKEVGIYSLGFRIGSMITLFTDSFNRAYSPVFYKLATSKNDGETKTTLSKYNYNFVMVIFFLTFLVILFSKEIIMLFDKRYTEAAKVLPVIAMGFFFLCASSVFNLSIYQVKKTKMMMVIMLLGSGIKIVFNFIFIPSLGMYGASYATLLSFFIIFFIKYFYSKKCYFIWINLGKIFLNLLISLFVVHSLKFFYEMFEINMVLMFLVKILVFSVMLWLIFPGGIKIIISIVKRDSKVGGEDG